ncbi:unnamed protein product [Polarella glacialis]|uniref:RmlD-like substrate binding domain-containing protein n=1 Tax=Polarella glacialis TaxID=89957 RepID=A0A813EFZ9_POLGL|nr:unnamed protein product [Polarella glacialis]
MDSDSRLTMGNSLPCFGSTESRGLLGGFSVLFPEAPAGKVLITGATGLLGRQVMRVFREKGWTVRGLAFSRASGDLVKVDLFDHAALDAQFADFQPDIVIHLAAERRPDKLEQDKEYATRINSDVARSVGELSKRHGAWLIYPSTNYVFDGKAAPYAEDAAPTPLSVYGESKLAGEVSVAQVHPEAAILRFPLLYGPVERLDETSVTTMLSAVKEGTSVKLDNWQERFPTSTEDLAEVIQAMSQARLTCSCKADFSGVFHWQANERQTKYTMGMAIAQIAGISTAHLVRIDDAPAPGSAPRPQFERMLCTRLEKLLGIEGQPQRFRSDFKESLGRHLVPFL